MSETPYARVTVLSFTDPSAKSSGVDELAGLVRAAHDLPGFLSCWVMDTGAAEAVMVTLYESCAAAQRASAAGRQHIGAAIGRYVSGPPQRWAGDLVIDEPGSAPG